CPCRAFLASLILAPKFMQDKYYSNHAWAKLATAREMAIANVCRLDGRRSSFHSTIFAGHPLRQGIFFFPFRIALATYVHGAHASPDRGYCHTAANRPRTTTSGIGSGCKAGRGGPHDGTTTHDHEHGNGFRGV
ncbi:hypothetical protein EDB84DRAFT_1276747, partial [Lactarius hengduanensis]